MEILEEINRRRIARGYADRGKWRDVGRIFGIRIFTSSAKRWMPGQRELVVTALETSAETKRYRADLAWKAQEFYPFSPPMPILDELVIPLERWRARQIRRIDQKPSEIQGTCRLKQ